MTSKPRAAAVWPSSTLADLDRLLATHRAAGMAITAAVDEDVVNVSPAIGREAYRIVQEGLTNAARHAGPAPVTLRLSMVEDGLEFELTNSLSAGPRAETGGGRGLAGIRERVAALHGQMSAGVEADRWSVTVHLPSPRSR